jgi:hypothetical protein
MGSGAVIYVPSFIKIGSGVQKLIGRDTHPQLYRMSPYIPYSIPPRRKTNRPKNVCQHYLMYVTLDFK